MKAGKQLVIGLFTSSSHAQALLQAVLCIAGQKIVLKFSTNHLLVPFLEEMLETYDASSQPPYDLFLVEIATTELVGKSLNLLNQLAARHIMPIIALTESEQIEQQILHPDVMVIQLFAHHHLPIQEFYTALEVAIGVSFPIPAALGKLIDDIERQHTQAMLVREQSWLDHRFVWLEQRKEWVDKRQIWLLEQLEWLEQQRQYIIPQLEWIREKQAWIEQQLDELNQQHNWLLQQERWLARHQHWLNQYRQVQPQQKDQAGG